MCKRSDAEKDPLLNTFLQRYQLNLLSVPRAGADVGELYVHDGKRVGSPGQLASFLAQPFVMPPIQRGEAMALLETNYAAAQGLDVQGATAWVTLEPCAHQGRTGLHQAQLVGVGAARVRDLFEQARKAAR